MNFPSDVVRVDQDTFVVNATARVERVEANWFAVTVPNPHQRRDFGNFRDAVEFAREETYAQSSL